jgi:hypothetical protein
MQAMRVPVRGVNQEVRIAGQFHVKPLRQQLEQIIVRLAEVGKAVAKIYADFSRLHRWHYG